MDDLPWGDIPYDHKSVAEVVHDFAVVRGDLSEQYARDQLVSWINRMIKMEREVHWFRGRDQGEIDGHDELAEKVRAELPDTCSMFEGSLHTEQGVVCTDLIGGTFGNGATFTKEMCCLPCRVRLVIDGC